VTATPHRLGNVYAGAAGRFDERRNTSRVIPVPPNALPDALRALERFRDTHPDLYAWIADGAPRLTDADHVARFGSSYKSGRGRRAEVT